MVKVGAKLKNVSKNTLYPGGIYTVGVTIDPETDNGRGDVPAIGLLNPDGELYSWSILAGEVDGVNELTTDQFAKICAGIPENFKNID